MRISCCDIAEGVELLDSFACTAKSVCSHASHAALVSYV